MGAVLVDVRLKTQHRRTYMDPAISALTRTLPQPSSTPTQASKCELPAEL